MTLYTGDAIEVMRTFPAESVDAVVTDPPSGIHFMQKSWDHNKGGRAEWVAWMTEVMRECYRLLVPGGWIVVWSMPRTCHWTGWAIEDAGFRITDQLAHVFAQGFPKGRAQLKPAREDWWLARKPGPLQPLQIDATRIGTADGHGGGASGTSGFAEGYEKGDGFAASQVGRWPSNLLLSDPELFDEPNPWVVGSGATATSGLMSANHERHTVGGNGLTHGAMTGETSDTYGDSGGYSRFFIVPKANRVDREPLANPFERGVVDSVDSQANHSLHRRNSHPTVKPTDLMRHLVRLVTPPGGTVLDCFLGSGSTAIAAEMEGFPWIGIEKEPEYVAIAEARLNGTQRGLGLDVPAPTRKRASGGSMEEIRARGGKHAVNDPADRSTKSQLYSGLGDEEPAA